MKGEWPADPTDPRCPSCDEPVSATAGYCLHCYADLPASDAPVSTAVADLGAERETGPGDGRDARGFGRETHAPTVGPGTGERPVDEQGLLHPDGLLDDVSTGAIALIGGLLVGVVAAPVAVWLLPDPLEGGVGPAAIGAWLAATAWIARTRTVFGAVRKAAYALAALLALVPVAVTIALADPDALFVGVLLWPVALAVAAVGRFVGRRADREA